jgi:hypothetical protein
MITLGSLACGTKSPLLLVTDNAALKGNGYMGTLTMLCHQFWRLAADWI